MNVLDDNVIAALDEGANVVGTCGCKNQNRYQLFRLKQLVLAGQMHAQMRRSNVLVNIASCAIVDGDQAVQELVWALFQAH